MSRHVWPDQAFAWGLEVRSSGFHKQAFLPTDQALLPELVLGTQGTLGELDVN